MCEPYQIAWWAVGIDVEQRASPLYVRKTEAVTSRSSDGLRHGAFLRTLGRGIMLSVRLTALPSPWTRVLAFRPDDNWLRRHYLRIALVALVLLISNEFYVSGTDLSAWDWLYVSGWITFLLTFRTTFLLPNKVDEVLSRLAASQVLNDRKNRLSDFRQRLYESSRRAARIGGVIIAAALALGWIVAVRGALPSHFLAAFLEVFGAFFVGSFIGRAVSYSHLGQRLKNEGFEINVDPEHLDGVAGLRPVGRLYFFQSALVAVPGVFLALWWFLIPLFGERYSIWRGVYAGLLVFVVLCEVLAFFSPMWSFHRIMSEGKAGLLTEADQISEQAAGIRKQLRGELNEGVIVQLEDRLRRLAKRYDAIIEMPTWPVDKRIQRRFALNNLLLFIPVIAQVVGASSSWQHFLEGLHKALSRQG
jgi:hypothetical protein